MTLTAEVEPSTTRHTNRDAVGLATFRVAFCGLVLWDLAELAAGSLWPLNRWLLLGPAVAATLVLVGRRWATVAMIPAQIAVAAFVPGFHTQDTLLIMGSWLLLLLPVDRALPHRPGPIPNNAVFLTGLVAGLIYLDSGIRKAFSPMWQAGLGVWAPASIPHAVHGRLPFLDLEPLMLAAGYGVILFEVAWLPLFAIKRLRRPLAVAGIVFHLGISIFYPFHIFSAGMVALLLPTAISGGPEQNTAPSALLRRVGLIWAGLSLVVLAGVVPQFTTVAASTQTMLFPVTGLYMRGVFDDSLFEHHDFQWGADHWTEEGFLARGVMNREWETWWKTEHINGPPVGAPVRYLDVSLTEHEVGLLTRNLAAEWTTSR